MFNHEDLDHIPADDRANPPDARVYHLALYLAKLSLELKRANLPGVTLVEKALQRALRLSDDLDPCNTEGVVPPLYPDVLGAEKLAERYGANVTPFRRR